jgi:hypothetical protein
MFCWDGSGKFKNTRKKGTDQENAKNQWRKEKQEIFTFLEVLILMCSASVRHQGLPPSCNPPSGEPTHTEPPYNFKLSVVFKYCSSV